MKEEQIKLSAILQDAERNHKDMIDKACDYPYRHNCGNNEINESEEQRKRTTNSLDMFFNGMICNV